MSIRTPVSTTIAQPSRDRPTISSHQPSTPATSTDASPGQTGGITTTFYTFHPMSPAIEESSIIASARRLVVKVGSSLVTNEGRGVDTAAVESWARSEEHKSELQSLMRISYADSCLKKK